ncbi:MAG: flagellar hook-associated protein FlgK [Lachnospiraceae bacterium]|nr:flagellar hook-associated protein FlgK [Lachnospiraceae bacterium]MBR5992443.1 flagellar hook-associated protein FlgK [Lachnospiraceae bacterium]
MPLMGSVYVGTSGLQTSQNSLNTTAHNLSNLGTTGFVRQQVLLGDRLYNTLKKGSVNVSSQQVGLGVTYEKVRQVRDYFLDQSYRKENGRASFYSTQYEAMNEVEDLLNELNDDASFNHAMTNFWSTLQELAKTPDDTTVQRMLIQNAQSFLTNAQQVYQGLIDYQNELNTHIKEKVDRINELGKTIMNLNDEIRKVEVGGIESANDYRDARNQALDELSGLVNIEYSEDVYHTVSVRVEGMEFINADIMNTMEVYTDAKTGFYTPYWKLNAVKRLDEKGDEYLDLSRAFVYNTEKIVSSENDTDIGQLRSMLYIRGDKVADYTDIPVKPEPPDADDYPLGTADPDYATAVNAYQKEFEKYTQKVDYYNHTVAQSVCMNVQAEFDQLIHNVVTAVNAVLKDAYDNAAQEGKVYMADDDGSPLEIFMRKECTDYTWNSTTNKWDYTEENIEDDYHTETLYSIQNLIINPHLLREAGKMKFRLDDKTVDYETAKALIDAFDADIYALNPNVTTRCSLNTYYTNLVSQVANSGSVYKNITEAQTITMSSIDAAREQILGVSSDEELSNMIKFQNAFNAASRYINVIDTLLDNIINNLG